MKKQTKTKSSMRRSRSKAKVASDERKTGRNSRARYSRSKPMCSNIKVSAGRVGEGDDRRGARPRSGRQTSDVRTKRTMQVPATRQRAPCKREARHWQRHSAPHPKTHIGETAKKKKKKTPTALSGPVFFELLLRNRTSSRRSATCGSWVTRPRKMRSASKP